jgi:HAD superfamily hydrolase (TIGR01490 family)
LAIFDVDETLIAFKSMFSFAEYLVDHGYPDMIAGFKKVWAVAAIEGRRAANSAYYRLFAAWEEDTLKQAGQEWFARESIGSQFWNTAVVDQLRRLVAEGCVPVFASGSFHALLDPIARELDVEYILCTELETDPKTELLTGLLSQQMIGVDKVDAVKRLADFLRADLISSWVFGDDATDMPVLRLVGNGRLFRNGSFWSIDREGHMEPAND